MPTANPRINITVKPERYELLKRLAAHQGTSMSGLISETMEMIYPVMERVCVVLEAAKMAQESSKEGFRQTIAKAEAEILPMLYQAVDQLDMFVDDASEALGAPRDSAAHTADLIKRIMDSQTSTGADVPPLSASGAGGGGVAATTENPRPVIRGSGSDRGTKSRAARGVKK